LNRRPPVRRLLAVAGATLAVLATVAPAQAAPAGAIDGGPCIAFDALGYRYIAFGRTGVPEPGIYLASSRSGTWRLSQHPIAKGERCAAMVIDAARYVHLLAVRALPDDPNGLGELRYSTNRSGTWRTSVVRYGEVGTTSLAIDRKGRATIATQDQDGAILLSRSATGGWVVRYDATGYISHLRVDPTGALWVVVADVGRQKVVRLTDRSGTWSASRIALSYRALLEFDLAIDGSGRRFLAVYDTGTGGVNIYRDLGSSWPRVDRTQAQPGRILTEVEIEPVGAIHLMLEYRRSATSWGVVDQNRHGGWHTQLVGYTSGFRADIEVDDRGRVGGTFDRDGVVWSYWNPWTKPIHRFAVSDL
jgi:hypothetical protein